MNGAAHRGPDTNERGPRAVIGRVRTALPHGGSLPEEEWRRRHRLIVVLLGLMIAVVVVYAVLARGQRAAQYVVEFASLLAFICLAMWDEASRKWRSVAASMGLLTA
jgi:hypothetical protein